MKKTTILLCINFLFCFFLNKHVAGQEKKILKTFIYQNKVFTYEFKQFGSLNYSFSVSSFDAEKKIKNDSSKVIKDTTTAKNDKNIPTDSLLTQSKADTSQIGAEEKFYEFDIETFKGIFTRQLSGKFNLVADKKKETDKAIEVFYSLKAKLDFVDDEPLTAYMILKKDTVVSVLKSYDSIPYTGGLSKPLAHHYVKEVSIETEDGTIKNVFVKLVKPLWQNSNPSARDFIIFKNQYPISISGKFDPEKLSTINLYCNGCGGIKGLTRYIKFSDILYFEPILENDKEDYSPVNTTLKLSPNEPIVELKKENRSKIIEVAAYTDFVGLNEKEPNGLLQFEAKRKININTKSFLLFGNSLKNEGVLSGIDLSDVEPKETKNETYSNKGERVYQLNLNRTDSIEFNVQKRSIETVYGQFLSNLEPKLTFSKLEQNNRFITAAKIVNNKIDPLQVFQYQVMSFGATMNIFKFSFPQQKFTWNVLNAGLYWYKTKIESLNDTISLNNSYYNLSTNFVFRPDGRWGCSMGFEYIKHTIWNANYALERDHGLYSIDFDGYLKTNSSAKLFFRFRWIYEACNFKNNFNQIQLGYSMNLFANLSGDKKAN